MGEGPKYGPPDAEQRTHLQGETVSVRWGGRAADRDGRAGARVYYMFVCEVGGALVREGRRECSR